MYFVELRKPRDNTSHITWHLKDKGELTTENSGSTSTAGGCMKGDTLASHTVHSYGILLDL